MAFAPSIIEMQPEMFTVRADVNASRAAAAPVTIEVLKPGGEIAFKGFTMRTGASDKFFAHVGGLQRMALVPGGRHGQGHRAAGNGWREFRGPARRVNYFFANAISCTSMMPLSASRPVVPTAVQAG